MTEILMPQSAALVPLTAEIVSAYVANNHVSEPSLPGLIAAIHEALISAATGGPATSDEPIVEKATPAQVKKSITPDALISFIDGKPYQTLKRHLAKSGLDPHSYRILYGLPGDYPMTAPGYSARRSELARSMGLGRKATEPAEATSPKKAARRQTTQAAA